MLEAAQEALALARGRPRADLDADRGLLLALVKCVEIVGEAAANVSPPARERLSDVPWRAIINMRHRLVHGYFDINRDIVWQTLQEDLPALISLLQPHLAAPDAPGEANP
jgi:uncharacterized protein with HEPN domain